VDVKKVINLFTSTDEMALFARIMTEKDIAFVRSEHSQVKSLARLASDVNSILNYAFRRRVEGMPLNPSFDEIVDGYLKVINEVSLIMTG